MSEQGIQADRVTGADESYLLAEDLFGLGAPIQFLWVFDRHPGEAALVRLRDELAAGSLNRRVRRTRVPLARDRWVRHDEVPDLRCAPSPIADDEIGAWMDERVRGSALRPADGHGWQLDGAPTGSGGYALSLLVSHMVSDGQGVYAALAAAHAGASTNTLPTLDQTRGWPGLRDDLTDARQQVAAAARSCTLLATALWKQRGKDTSVDSVPKEPQSPKAAMTPDRGGPETTLATADVDKEQWIARAAEHGGTSNSLFTALLGGLVQRSGYPVPAPAMRLCIAVSRRGDGDERANASGGVWIRVPGEITPDRGLGEIRALSKEAFIDYANNGAAAVADNLQPVVRLLPKRLIGKMMQSIPGPDTTVSNLGVVPRTALELGGETATSFGIRAIMQGRPPQHRRTLGPAVAAWAVEYGDKVTITFFGIHPDHFGDADLMRKQIGEELTAWGLDHRMW
ncbi:hypothetical protein [Williamsia soli]|uniref:hypothetical protein n=1 Tax=Williamsia soli TaxID=364929 RepID=UPI001A9D7918|nr:hypothetical protein [Williamsia soli]